MIQYTTLPFFLILQNTSKYKGLRSYINLWKSIIRNSAILMRTWRSCMRAALQSAFIVIPKIPQTHHVCRDSTRAWRKQMCAASQDSESSCNKSQKDRRPTTYKKTPLSFDIGKTTVFHTASLRLCSFLARHFCSKVGTIVRCQCRCCKARQLRDSRKLFHFLRQALSCRVSSAKEHRRSSDSVPAAINEKAQELHL